MPKVLELQRANDPSDVVHEIVQTLIEGRLVGLPTDTLYCVAGYALDPRSGERIERLRQAQGLESCSLALKGPAEAVDYVPGMSPLGRKLTRRFWPGPVTLVFDGAGDDGLAGALPDSTRAALSAEGGLPLRVPAHDAVGMVLRLLPAPLILAGETGQRGPAFSSAEELIAAVDDEVSLVVDAGPCRYGQPTSRVRVRAGNWALDREGVVKRRTLQRLSGNLVLFICTGNTCRSPMAEALFRKLLSERLGCSEDELVDRGYMIASAGMAAASGSPPSPDGVEVLKHRGIDLRGHESQPVTPLLLSQADYIFTMTAAHREQLIREFPEAAHRVGLLARDGSDVIDPIGCGIEEYRVCADQIERHLRPIVADLLPGSPTT